MDIPPIFYMDTTTDWIEGGNSFAEQGSDLAGWLTDMGNQAVTQAAESLGVKPAVPDVYRGGILAAQAASTGAAVAAPAGGTTRKISTRPPSASSGALAAIPEFEEPTQGIIDRLLSSPLALGLGIYLAIKYL